MQSCCEQNTQLLQSKPVYSQSTSEKLVADKNWQETLVSSSLEYFIKSFLDSPASKLYLLLNSKPAQIDESFFVIMHHSTPISQLKPVFHLRINSRESNFSFVLWAVVCNRMKTYSIYTKKRQFVRIYLQVYKFDFSTA